MRETENRTFPFPSLLMCYGGHISRGDLYSNSPLCSRLFLAYPFMDAAQAHAGARCCDKRQREQQGKTDAQAQGWSLSNMEKSTARTCLVNAPTEM